MVMFSTSKAQREAVRERYSAKVPEPLTHQFPQRCSKDEAIKRHHERKQTRTELFPPGNANKVHS